MPEDLYLAEPKSVLIETFGASPKLRIIDFFMDNPLFDFTKKEVYQSLGMSKQTFYKYFPDIQKQGIVAVSRKIGKAKLYKLSPNNSIVKTLRECEVSLSTSLKEK